MMARCSEALTVLDEAGIVLPDGKHEAQILVNRANCLMAKDDFDNAFIAAEAATRRGDAQLAAFAMLQMAECRMWQGRVPEALTLYVRLEEQLPSKFVDLDRVQIGKARATAFLEKRSPQSKPF